MFLDRDCDLPRRSGLLGLVVLSAVLGSCLTGASTAQAQELESATSAGGASSAAGSDEGRAVATDSAGNSYITGPFVGPATFGAGEPNETTLTSGFFDAYVAKYAPDGSLLWARKAGGAEFDQASSIATDGSGNSYVTGVFVREATFGAGEANETTLTAAGNSADIFIAKYDPAGVLVWAKRAGGNGNGDQGLGIATDAEGNSYVTGVFRDVAVFGPGDANQTTLTAPGFRDEIFLAKYDPDGALVWATRAGGSETDQGLAVVIDDAGNSYLTGFVADLATFGPGEANETVLRASLTDIFVAKYDPSGALLWARVAGGTRGNRGTGVAADGSGSSYVTGLFSGTVTFGRGEANQTSLTSAGSLVDVFVAKYDSSGSLAWARRAGGSSSDRGAAIAADDAGNTYVTGDFRSAATFGAGEANQTTVVAAGLGDAFVASYAPDGRLLWVTSAGSATRNDQGLGIAHHASGSTYVSGVFADMATFGEGEPNETVLTSAGGPDIFVARFAGAGDADGDGILDAADNCPDDANADQLDTDLDGDGDACDADDDNDAVADAGDNCPFDANVDQADVDRDGAGDACDTDLDGDGVLDAADACLPTVPGDATDANGCSIAQRCPCDNAWKNHGAYVSCTARTASGFLDLGLITSDEKDAIVSAAAQSRCGGSR